MLERRRRDEKIGNGTPMLAPAGKLALDFQCTRGHV